MKNNNRFTLYLLVLLHIVNLILLFYVRDLAFFINGHKRFSFENANTISESEMLEYTLAFNDSLPTRDLLVSVIIFFGFIVNLFLYLKLKKIIKLKQFKMSDSIPIAICLIMLIFYLFLLLYSLKI